MVRRRIVSFARDDGSIQAIAPVLRALQSSGEFDLRPIAFNPDVRPYLELDIRPTRVEAGDFISDPYDFARRMLERWQPAMVLLGASAPTAIAPNTPEQYLTAECKNTGVPTVAVLDAWGYYAERFGLTSEMDLSFVPDLICALDRTCEQDLLRMGVPEGNIVVTHNPWLDHVVAANPLPLIDRNDGILRVLFVSQPLAENRHTRKWPYTQHELFCQVVAALRSIRETRASQLLVWLHPGEDRTVWSQHIAGASDVAAMIGEQRGIDAFRNIDALVTSHSTLVYEALHLDLPCFSLRPGDPPLARHLPDIVGLTAKAMNSEELAMLFLAIDRSSRNRLEAVRLRFLGQGVFFSDGRATERVVAAIHAILHQKAV